jgi:hypothetical protein
MRSLGPKKVQAAKPVPGANDWRPHTTRGFEVNGLGQLRTVGHQPGTVPDRPRKRAAVETEGGDCA